MYTLLILLSFLSLVGAWYYWKKKPNKKYLIICVVLAFVFGGLSTTTNGYKAEEADEAASSSKVESSRKASSKKEESQKKAKSSSVAASKASSAKKASELKKNGAMSDSDVKKLLKDNGADNLDIKSVTGTYADRNSKDVTIELRGQENVTAKMTAKGFLMDTASVWTALKKSGDAKNFENVNVSIKFPLEDTAGNKSNEWVMKTSLSGDKINNINADNFKSDNVPVYADKYWQSNVFPRLD